MRNQNRVSFGLYLVPLPESVPRVVQRNSTTHVGRDQYAVDFLVPEGAPVLCARDGVVVLLKSDSDRGGPDKCFSEDANFIVIRHANRESTFYAHLTKGSVTVKVGEAVRVGQPIALQGSTGWTYAPHLHFAVFRSQETVRVRFDEVVDLPK